MTTSDVKLPAVLLRWRGRCFIAAPVLLGLGLVLSVLIGTGDRWNDSFMQAWLYSFVLVAGLSIGSIALLFIHHMTSGAWSFVIQRILEANTRVLPLVGILFIPILLGPLTNSGVHDLYDAWVHPSGTMGENIELKAAYLNPQAWAARAALYFTIFGSMAFLLNTWSKRLDDTANVNITLNFRRLSPPAQLLWCITMTFAPLDWMMSLEPSWYSTIYGPHTWISQGLTLLAFSTIILSYIGEEKPLSQYLRVEHFHHLGNLMMAFTVLWAYMSFSPFLIIWAGNLPEEISYYIARWTPEHNILAVILMFFHFFLPLNILLHRRFKKSVTTLRKICVYILIMRCVDVFWVINPSFHVDAPGIYWQDVLTHLCVLGGMFSLWFYFFVGQLQKRPLLSLNDPRLYEAVDGGHAAAHGEIHEHA